MTKIVINGDVVLKRNNATDAQGVAIPPTVESMNYGEIAINYNAKDACIFIKALDANGQQKIVKFVGEEVIAKTLGDILGESAADLATLKEMIKLFEGSSSDVLTLVKNLQTEVSKKLGKTETAADSSKLGGKVAADYWNKANSNISGIEWNASKFIVHGTKDTSSVLDFKADGVAKGFVGWNRTTGLITLGDNTNVLQLHTNGDLLWKSKTVWHAGNSNLSTVDWACKALTADGFIKGSKGIGVAVNERILFNANAVGFQWGVREQSANGYLYFDTKDGTGGWEPKAYFNLKGELFIAGSKMVWHSGNSNLSTVDWNSKNMVAYGSLSSRFATNGNVTAALISSSDTGGYVSLYDNSGNLKALFGAQTGLELNSGSVSIPNASDYKIKDKSGVTKRVLSIDINNDVYIGSMDTGLRDLYIRYNGNNTIKFTGTNTSNTIVINNNCIGLGINPTERLEVNGGNISITGGSSGSESSPQWRGFKLKNYAGNDLVKVMIGDCSSTHHTGFFIIDQRKNDNTGSFIRRFQITPYGDTVIDSPLTRLKGGGLIDGNLVVKGETYTYSADGIETFEAGGGATRLADLADVDLSGAQGNFVLYQSTETNGNGDRIWKTRSDAKSWSDISGKPTTFTPVEHSHIGSTYVTTPSDRALKTDLKRIDLATNTILSLTPYTYNWTTQAIETFGFRNHHAAGVIAQEIESILPFAVQPLNEEFKAVDYIQIIPYLIAAFQELHSALQDKNIAIANESKEYKRAFGANEKLAKRVSELESELINLKNQIAA